VGGNATDLFIARTTAYDKDTSLLAILKQWNSRRSYTDPVANLRCQTRLAASGDPHIVCAKWPRAIWFVSSADAPFCLGASCAGPTRPGVETMQLQSSRGHQ